MAQAATPALPLQKRMHRLLTFILLPLFALPSAVAASSVLVDLESSQIILSDRPRTPENASSMLPLMTVYTTLELLKNGTIENKLFESVKNPWGGPDLTLADLLQGLLMTGDPEAAEAVRQTLQLSEKDFSRQLNHTANALGMFATEFTFPCNENTPCISTAQDMALLAESLYTHHAISRIWGASHSLTLPDGKILHTENFFLEKSPAITGVYVSPKKKHIASSAAVLSENPKGSDGRLRRLLAVSLNNNDRDSLRQEISSLLLRGYRDYETLKLYSDGDFVANVPIYKGEETDVRAVVPQTVFITMTTEQMLTAGAKALEVRVRYASPLIAPIKAGQYVGTLEIHAGLKLAQTIPLVAQSDVDEGNFWKRFRDTVRIALSQEILHQ